MNGPPKDMFRMTVDPVGQCSTLHHTLHYHPMAYSAYFINGSFSDAPDAETFLRIEFVSGIPTKVINKSTGVEKTDPLEAFVFLNEGTSND